MVRDLQSPYHMRIKNKYLRNRHVYKITWNRVRSKEHPYQTLCSYHWLYSKREHEEQVRDNFKYIEEQTRRIINGFHCCSFNNAPSRYRRKINRARKSTERNIMAKIRQGDYELELPKFKNDAAYLYW
jgi:hypothetical protein